MEKNLSVTNKLEQAKLWVQAAGAFLRENINGPVKITEKTRPDDLVTNYDQLVQKNIVGQIKHAFPDDLILAEEDEIKTAFSASIPSLWILDPIDGTTNFIVQRDKFAVMLAYYEYGVGKFGIILDVMKERLYWSDEAAAYCNDRLLKKKDFNLHYSLIGVNAYMYRTNTGGLLDLSFQTLGVRTSGSAGISYTDLFEGKLMGYFSNLQPWDYAAGSIIASQLGFVTKSLDGGEPTFSGREMIYTVPKSLQNEIQNYLKSSKIE
ncbi:inositol monophosphatase family protein [Lactococcus fujiensis]|uniref:inositol monophosphatase family protein n=1 Tax=Lactococcus fujiensis TaxID=610251 RepID=UPI001FE74D4A|nr:inositol monophosphatase family protein [Lactococcus fujiensis]